MCLLCITRKVDWVLFIRLLKNYRLFESLGNWLEKIRGILNTTHMNNVRHNFLCAIVSKPKLVYWCLKCKIHILTLNFQVASVQLIMSTVSSSSLCSWNSQLIDRNNTMQTQGGLSKISTFSTTKINMYIKSLFYILFFIIFHVFNPYYAKIQNIM